MTLLIDTNRYTDFARNDANAVSRFIDAERIAVPFVVLAELRAGFRCGTIAGRNEGILIRFLANDKVDVLFADSRTTRVYADLFALLKRNGTPIPTNDLWIAALAVQHGLPLYTRDRHFEKIPHLTLAS